jgi:hypothetical protein
MRSIELVLAIIGAWTIISLVAGGLLVAVRSRRGRRRTSSIASEGRPSADSAADRERPAA